MSTTRWLPVGWAATDSGGELVEMELHLPGHIKGVIASQYEHTKRDPKLGDWYWWTGRDRDFRPPEWPGNGPCKTMASAKRACEEKMASLLRQALGMLES